MAPPGPDQPGLADRLRALAGDGLEYAEARLRLLQLEAQESGGRLGRALALLLAAALTAQLALFGLAAALATLLHERGGMGWVPAFLIVTALNALAAIALALAARRAARHPHFASTLDEIRKDRAWLLTRNPPPTAPH